MTRAKASDLSERELLEAHAKALEAQVEGLRAEVERLRGALESAVDVIETWHNMHGCASVWDIYWRNAPEMKPIREALAPR